MFLLFIAFFSPIKCGKFSCDPLPFWLNQLATGESPSYRTVQKVLANLARSRLIDVEKNRKQFKFSSMGLDIRPLLPYLKREPRHLWGQIPGLARRG